MGTLEKVAEIGYKYIELANHHAAEDPGTGFNISADKLKGKLDAVGLKVIGGHAMPLNEKNIDGVIRYHRDIGSRNIVIPIDFWQTKADVLRRCSFYNAMGERCRANGINLFFHNHYHEFQRFDGDYIFDLILKNTDPELLSIEVDAYWTFRGALDPAQKIREYSSRVGLLHQKDFPLDQVHDLNVWRTLNQNQPLDTLGFHSAIKPEYFTEIGDGIMNIQDVIDAGNDADVTYIFVEQDYVHDKTEFESITRSLQNLKKMRGLEFE
jgi:sugar phosphate isomerase/epimerase